MAGPQVHVVSFSPVIAPWQLFLSKQHTRRIASADTTSLAPDMSLDLEVAILMCCRVC
jgi:hypothetical protein